MPKKILIGVSGSIAAYKVAHLVRLFVKQGDEVRVVMTRAATDFITPLTLSTLSKNPVLSEVATEEGWNNHVELGLWADAYIIAPATANTLAKLAQGLCDNLLTAAYLSARCPVFVAPAMDLDMWDHPATLRNLKTLEHDGVKIIPVGDGELASGLMGKGRMAEPEQIIQEIEAFFKEKQASSFAAFGKKLKALVTAGPTFEPLDPVRFIGNHSTGRMGIAIADAFAQAGMEVHLVLGPSALKPSHPNVHLTKVQTASQMHDACQAVFGQCQVAVMAAAVADYRPANFSEVKIKKKESDMSIPLERTVDIAASLGKIKSENQVFVGFALETNDEEANALGKVHRKNFDFIVLNSLRDAGAGFGHETNKVTFLFADGQKKSFSLKQKTEVATDIVQEVFLALKSKNDTP